MITALTSDTHVLFPFYPQEPIVYTNFSDSVSYLGLRCTGVCRPFKAIKCGVNGALYFFCISFLSATMTVSKLKEAFAFAETVEERELLVKQLAVQGSDDWIYYTGLILLQKLHSEMSLVEDCSRLREPTARESELMQEMRDFLAKYKDKDTEELEIRFNILIYPINADDASEFLRRKLGIQELAQLQQQQQQSHSPDSTPTPTQHRFNSAKRSSLDQSFLEPQRLLKNVLKSPNEYTRMKVLAALPELAKMNLDELSAEERRNLAWLLTRYPVASSYTEFVTQALSGYLNESTNLSHLTLEQLDKLRSSDPSLNEKKEFMEAYLCKLQPHRFLHQATKTGSWDDSQGILEEYVSTAWEFIKSMSSPIFNPIKGLLLFYKLRIKAARQQFDDIELFREQVLATKYVCIFSKSDPYVLDITNTRQTWSLRDLEVST